MDKKLNLLRIVALIAGILMIVYYAQRTISHIIFLFRVDFYISSLLGFTTLIGIAAGILLIKAAKKLKSGEQAPGLSLMQIGSILLFVVAAFPLYYTITNFEYLGDFEYIISQFRNILIPVAFPIFFFVFKSKLD
jgi:hypothetical protein